MKVFLRELPLLELLSYPYPFLTIDSLFRNYFSPVRTLDHQETNLPRSIQSSIEISYLLHCVLYNFLNPRIWSQRIKIKKKSKKELFDEVPKEIL
jgi:hypothetical protein